MIPKSQTGKKTSPPTVEIDGPSGVDDLLKTLTKGSHGQQRELKETQLSDIDVSSNASSDSGSVKNISFYNKKTTGQPAPKKKSK